MTTLSGRLFAFAFGLIMWGCVSITQAQTNLNFETGDYTGWSGRHGYNKRSDSAFVFVNSGITYGVDADIKDCNYYQIITSASGNDYYGGFPVISPTGGGNFSARIGSEGINEGKYDPVLGLRW